MKRRSSRNAPPGLWFASSGTRADNPGPSRGCGLAGSWGFEADGGYSDSVWTKDGAKWVVKTNSTVSDGSKVSATHIVTPVDADTVTWQSKDQTLNGKPLPDTKQIKMKRVQ